MPKIDHRKTTINIEFPMIINVKIRSRISMGLFINVLVKEYWI